MLLQLALTPLRQMQTRKPKYKRPNRTEIIHYAEIVYSRSHISRAAAVFLRSLESSSRDSAAAGPCPGD